MEKTLELTSQKMPAKSIKKLAQIFNTLCWEFPDYNLFLYSALDDEGRFSPLESIEGESDAQITMDAERLLIVVYGRGNLPKMFFSGQIKIRGLPKFKLIKFVPLLGPFLESYKEACEQVSGE
jgi:hypothetical protein